MSCFVIFPFIANYDFTKIITFLSSVIIKLSVTDVRSDRVHDMNLIRLQKALFSW